MKIIVLLALLGAVLAEDIEYYTTSDDFLDMNQVLEDPEWTQAYMDCFLGKKPCHPVPASYLLVIADSIENGCYKCNNGQKHLSHTFIDGLRTKWPVHYEKFAKKFDPEGIWMDVFLEKTKGF